MHSSNIKTNIVFDMHISKTNKQASESLIEQALVGTSKEERQELWMNDIESQQPTNDQFYWGFIADSLLQPEFKRHTRK